MIVTSQPGAYPKYGVRWRDGSISWEFLSRKDCIVMVAQQGAGVTLVRQVERGAPFVPVPIEEVNLPE